MSKLHKRDHAREDFTFILFTEGEGQEFQTINFSPIFRDKIQDIIESVTKHGFFYLHDATTSYDSARKITPFVFVVCKPDFVLSIDHDRKNDE